VSGSWQDWSRTATCRGVAVRFGGLETARPITITAPASSSGLAVGQQQRALDHISVSRAHLVSRAAAIHSGQVSHSCLVTIRISVDRARL
jgi:hypothetical protein